MTWTVIGFVIINTILAILSYLTLRRSLSSSHESSSVNANTCSKSPDAVQISAVPDVIPVRTNDGTTLFVPSSKLAKLVQAQLVLRNDQQTPTSTAENYEVYIERLCSVKVPVRVKVERPDIWVAQQCVQEAERTTPNSQQ